MLVVEMTTSLLLWCELTKRLFLLICGKVLTASPEATCSVNYTVTHLLKVYLLVAR